VTQPTVSTQDHEAAAILRQFQPSLLKQYSPRATVGDGNCCYRAASLGKFGVQEHHLHVRLLAAIEMLLYRHLYDVNAVDYCGPINAAEVFTGSYDDVISTVTTVGAYAELVHIYAISAALGVMIKSYYPPMYGLGNSPYSRTVCGRGVRGTQSPAFVLMWSMFNRPMEAQPFHPNHFVLLLERNMMAEPDSITDINDDDAAVAASAFRPDQVMEYIVVTDDSELEHDTSDAGDNDEQSHDGHDSDRDTSSVEFLAPPSQSADDDDEPVTDNTLAVANFTPLPDATWLTTADIIALLRDPSTQTTHSSVPNGHKENVYFLVDNTQNTARHGRGIRRAYDDDYGAWNAAGGRLNNFPYICGDGGSLRRVFLSGGQYCNERKSAGRRIYVPLEPQPPPATVTMLTRYYATSAADSRFKKRVSWIAESPAVAIVEYLGSQPPALPHGNAKSHKSRPFVRTPAATMQEIGAAEGTRALLPSSCPR